MAIFITEYSGAAFVSGRVPGAIPQSAGKVSSTAALDTTTVLSSAATSTMTLLPTTRLIAVVASSAWAWVLPSASSASTTIATATNAQPIAPNQSPFLLGVTPGSRLTALSA